MKENLNPDEKAAKEVQRKEEIKKRYHLKRGKRKVVHTSCFYNTIKKTSCIVALCNDDTVWLINPDANKADWTKVIDIPQP